MCLILPFLLSRGSEQPLFGCAFFFFNSAPGTHIRSVWQSVTPCLFLNHILFYSSSQLWQTSNRRVDINFLVMQRNAEASCLRECVLWKRLFSDFLLSLDISLTTIWCTHFDEFGIKVVLLGVHNCDGPTCPLHEYAQTLKAFIQSS